MVEKQFTFGSILEKEIMEQLEAQTAAIDLKLKNLEENIKGKEVHLNTLTINFEKKANTKLQSLDQTIQGKFREQDEKISLLRSKDIADINAKLDDLIAWKNQFSENMRGAMNLFKASFPEPSKT